MKIQSMRIRAGILAVCAAIAGGVAGGALAQGEPEIGSSLAAEEAQVVQDANLDQATLRAMWEATAAKAEAGELSANVDQADAARTLRAAIDPPNDPDAANELEAKMIELTDTLRQSGDLPALGDQEAFKAYTPEGE